MENATNVSHLWLSLLFESSTIKLSQKDELWKCNLKIIRAQKTRNMKATTFSLEVEFKNWDEISRLKYKNLRLKVNLKTELRRTARTRPIFSTCGFRFIRRVSDGSNGETEFLELKLREWIWTRSFAIKPTPWLSFELNLKIKLRENMNFWEQSYYEKARKIFRKEERSSPVALIWNPTSCSPRGPRFSCSAKEYWAGRKVIAFLSNKWTLVYILKCN